MGARAGTTITKIPNLGKFAEEFTRSYHLVGRKSDFDKKNWSSSRAQWARISSWLAGSEAGSHPETGSAGGESGYSMRDGARSERNHEFAAEPSKPTRQGVGLELAWLMFGGIEISGTMLLASYSWLDQSLHRNNQSTLEHTHRHPPLQFVLVVPKLFLLWTVCWTEGNLGLQIAKAPHHRLVFQQALRLHLMGESPEQRSMAAHHIPSHRVASLLQARGKAGQFLRYK
ncbi:hypothetical protein H4Q26_003725 [Puccinia striiformis f. sp. tritici PST-130]|nr:hypothetical protein H4Q26_003725 [Puccinia striiformis f. sp. tritici PST-130]